MPRKSDREKLEDERKKLEIQKARIRELSAKVRTAEKKQERKERTHRLIQIGAICEEIYGDAITEGAMQDALRQFLKDQETRGIEKMGTGFYSAALNKAKNPYEV